MVDGLDFVSSFRQDSVPPRDKSEFHRSPCLSVCRLDDLGVEESKSRRVAKRVVEYVLW